MPSAVDICNLALSHIGNGVEINDLEKENTSEAGSCRRFYTPSRDEVMRAFPWPIFTVSASLALVTTDPTTEWAYAYRYPADCLMFGRILGDDRNETRATRVPYRFARDDQGVLVYTDRADAVAEYQALNESTTDPTFWPPDFCQAVALLLASYIAPRVTGGDPYKLGLRAQQRYLSAIATAQAAALNEEQPEELPDSEFISSRDG